MADPDISSYDYDLPVKRIAQSPLAERDAARLMVLRRPDRQIEESTMNHLPAFLRPGDCLVLNDTRVSACRLTGRVSRSAAPSAGVSGAGKNVEILIVRHTPLSEFEWDVDAMVYPGKRFKPGVTIDIGRVSVSDAPSGESAVRGEVLAVSEIGRRIRIAVSGGRPGQRRRPIREILNEIGAVPMPPYITNPNIPPDRYQTCYAKEEGSAAAPTAGLHFTPELFRRLAAAKIRTAFLTLHVGPGTFRPVTAREMESGRLHPEPYRLGVEAADEIRRTQAGGGRVVAVGTTTCRTLEWIAGKFGEIRPDAGVTDLFIRENFSFRAVDGLLTNFHLPKTSLLMLVAAFAGRVSAPGAPSAGASGDGRTVILDAYREAIRRNFRFYSFGDAMLLV